jgi:integrase
MAFPNGRSIQLRYIDPELKKEVRLSTGTHDEAEALEQKAKLEAKLLLGLDIKAKRRSSGGLAMQWSDFREQYTELRLNALRPKAAQAAESRLDLVERILKPNVLADVASGEALALLQSRLLAGVENPSKRPRSKHSVKSRMAAVVAALIWACEIGWLETVPRFTSVEVAKLKKMKGRPISGEEFDRMISMTKKVVGDAAASSWEYLLRGAALSGLRLDELMHLSWDDSNEIMLFGNTGPNRC